MASINYLIKSKKNPATVYIRLTHNKTIDCITSTGLQTNTKHWDSKNKRFRKVLELPNAEQLNEVLSKLKLHTISQFNETYISGEAINSEWLSQRVKIYFNRPVDEMTRSLEKIFFSDFCMFWLKNYAPKHKISASKYLSGQSLKAYEVLAKLAIEFEGKQKIRLKDISSEIMDSFSNFLSNDKQLAVETVIRHIRRFKFFCERAEELNFTVNKNYKQTVYVSDEKKKDYKEPYFNEQEISAIYNLHYEDESYESTKDNLIISCWTGLRISDFMHTLKRENIYDGFIHIPATKKTGQAVSIPLHPMVKEILDKRNGNLPLRSTDITYNSRIKKIAAEAGINAKMKGGIFKVKLDPNGNKIKRKVIDIYPKNKLVSSHIGRRSFATNLFGKVDNHVIMAVGGWTTENIMLDYVKKTNFEQAKQLKDFWDKL